MGMSHKTEILKSFVSKFTPTDIDVEILAKNLGLSESRFPDEQYLAADTILLRIIDEVLPHLRWKSDPEIGDYFYEHVDEIMWFCEWFEQIGRLPALITDESLFLHEDTYRENLRMSEKEYFHALFSCTHIIVYLSVIKKFGELQTRYTPPWMVYQIDRLVRDEWYLELNNSWGWKVWHYYEKIISREKRRLLGSRYISWKYKIPPELEIFYKNKKIDFWLQGTLPPERVLINILSLTGPDLTPEQHDEITKQDMSALNFFLCQTDSSIYIELITRTFSWPMHYTTWELWIHTYIDQLRKHGSEINKIFRAVFGLWNKKLFVTNKWELTSDTQKNLPAVLQMALLESELEFLKKQTVSTNDAIAGILAPSPYTSSIVSQQNKSHTPKKERIEMPSISSLFVSAAEWSQPESISFPKKYLPAWTTVNLERIIWGKKDQTFPLAHEGVTDIPAVENLEKDLHFSYVVRIKLPKWHIFTDGESGTTLTPYRVYVKVPREIQTAAPVVRPREEEKTVSPIIPTIQTKVTSVLEKPAKTLLDTITAWELSIEEKSFSVELQEDGVVIFQLNTEFMNELHESQFATLRVDELGVMTPDIGSEDIQTRMITLASELRQKEEAEKLRQIETQREEKARIKETWEKIELDSLILAHQRLFLIANETEEKISALKRNNIGDLRSIAQDFTSELAKIGWSVTVWAFSAILKKNNEWMISVMEGHFNIYQSAWIEMSWAQRRLRYMIGENFQSLIQILYLGKTGKKWTLISQMRDRRNDIVVYREALQKWKGRLIVLPPSYHSKIQSGFPTGWYPLIIENVSPASIDSRIVELKEAHPECEVECCITKDAVTINGAISAMEASAILNSPRALYILKKRILLTYGFIQDPKDVNRTAIEYPKIPPTIGTKSARSILQELVKPYWTNLRQEDINDEFLRSYVHGLQVVGIKIGYNLPVTMTRETLEQGVEKKPTAD